MKLLDRIAYSNGDLERTVVALRLINERLMRQLNRRQIQTRAALCPEDLAAYFDQPENQNGTLSSPPNVPGKHT